MIVQGTGSRLLKANDLPIADEVLRHVTAGHEGPHELRQGGASGADTLLAIAARRLGWTVRTFRADWSGPCLDTCDHNERRPNKHGDGTYCPAAGDYRNDLMVQLRPVADVCVALLKIGAANKGTRDCIRRASGAGIPVTEVDV